EPSEGHLVVQRLEAGPRLSGGGDVDESEEDPGHELQRKDGQRGAAEHVPPARAVARHRMLGRVADRRGQLQTGVEPGEEPREIRAHGGLPPASAATPPGVGSAPAWMSSWPFSTREGNSKSPRSGGPEARAPSR